MTDREKLLEEADDVVRRRTVSAVSIDKRGHYLAADAIREVLKVTRRLATLAREDGEKIRGLERELAEARADLHAARHALGLHRSMVICGEGQSSESELAYDKGMHGDAARARAAEEGEDG